MAGEILKDGENKIKVVDLGVSFEAIADKIIVLYDSFKSGYECKNCTGKGTIIAEREVFDTTSNEWHKPIIECPVCKGKKALIVIPENAKSLPSTGTVVSRGAGCPDGLLPIGTRVVFAPHVGTMIPMKNNVKLKIMRIHEPLCTLEHEKKDEFDDLDSSQFMDYEAPIE